MRYDHSPMKHFLASFIPRQNRLLYRLCKWYVDRYNGESDSNMETNGELRFMQSALPQCYTVFDIGANVGHWAAMALAINPKINLHCFEPSSATFQKLLANNFPLNVICNNFGLSSAPGEVQLFVFEDGAGINSLYRREGLEEIGLAMQQHQETIHVETADRYCQTMKLGDAIDFCKVDVEGHELEVLKGMTAMLTAKQIKIIQFEYGGCNIDAGVLLKDIFSFFKRFDYMLYKIYPQKLCPIPRYDQRLENFQYQNWAAIANGFSIRA